MSSSKDIILLIGPLPKPAANKVGGARVSFQQLVTYMAEQSYNFQLIETQPYALGWKKVLNPLQLLLRFFAFIWKTDIVWLNVSQKGTRFLAPLLYCLTKLSGKQFVFRPFGSSLQDDFQRYGNLQQYWFKNTALKADILFLQTHQSIDFFRPLAKNIQHLPTSRPAPKVEEREPDFQKRFLFLGHIKSSKGIDEILAAQQQLDDNYQIHLYGPIMEDQYKQLFAADNTIYKGVVQRDQINAYLQAYDVLLLPTYFSGEGYPGAIIEAYSLGLPVIATQWRAIPEIVKDGQTGRLIEPKNIAALVEAIQSFDTENYPLFSLHAWQYFQERFVQEVVLKTTIKTVFQLGN
ncbi:MAG: glycosyltransferase family 4 protein [Bacteroidota bacterium]